MKIPFLSQADEAAPARGKEMCLELVAAVRAVYGDGESRKQKHEKAKREAVAVKLSSDAKTDEGKQDIRNARLREIEAEDELDQWDRDVVFARAELAKVFFPLKQAYEGFVWARVRERRAKRLRALCDLHSISEDEAKRRFGDGDPDTDPAIYAYLTAGIFTTGDGEQRIFLETAEGAMALASFAGSFFEHVTARAKDFNWQLPAELL